MIPNILINWDKVLEPLLKQIKDSIIGVLINKDKYTGSITLTINFLNGEPKDIIKEVEKQRVKVK